MKFRNVLVAEKLMQTPRKKRKQDGDSARISPERLAFVPREIPIGRFGGENPS